MASDYHDDEPTLPPLDPRAGPVCPRCYAPLIVVDPALPGALPRCPRHGLAFIDAKDIVESGGDPLLGSTIAGRFTVTGRLGAGSMGAVYRARQEAVDRDVALKIVRGERAYDPETKTRFEREARATSALRSPNTVIVYDFGEAEDGSVFLAMELLEGETVGERLRRMTRLPLPDAVRIAREALKSLAEAHSKGIIHRDLKPDNLFLARVPGEGGIVEITKVLDFGIAKLVHGETQRVDSLETQAGTVFGTPRYMSPEQAQGNKLDPRTDLYSLGVILYQMICGRAPFIDDDAVVVMARHIKDEPPRFADVDPELLVPPVLEGVIRRVLAKFPNLRPQSAEQMAAELEGALGEASVLGTGVHASWVASRMSARPSPRARRAAWVAGGLVLVTTLLIGGFALVRRLVRPPAAPAVAAQTLSPSESKPAGTGATTESPVPVASSEAEALPSAEPAQKPSSSGTRRPRKGSRGAPRGAASAPATKRDEDYGRFE